MKSKSQPYPTVYVIFTLLNNVRRGSPQKNIWREFHRQGIALKPRLSFWIPLCKQAGLLKENNQQLRVSSYASAWLKKTPEEQILILVEAWQNSPKNKKTKQFRKKLLWKLKYNKPLTAKDHTALNGLDALGITTNGTLNSYGRYFIQNKGNLPTPAPVAPCVIQDEKFIAPLHSYLHLLWQLELYLRPSRPGIYPLTKRALHFYDGDPFELITLLEQGLKSALPEPIKAILLKQPSIQVVDGIVLEFSTPAELAQLRRQPALRKYFEKFLSSQSVLIARQNEKIVYKLLKRRGVYLYRNEEQAPVKKERRTHFSQKSILQPVGKLVPKLVLIEKYKQLAQALDIIYRAPGYNPEQRRITPLAVEKRGEHTYVIAHCQTRRGQRTFRLDRMEIPGTW